LKVYLRSGEALKSGWSSFFIPLYRGGKPMVRRTFMKKCSVLVAGILSVLVFGLTLTGCDNPTGNSGNNNSTNNGNNGGQGNDNNGQSSGNNGGQGNDNNGQSGDGGGIAILSAPLNVYAYASSSSSITVSWTTVSGATSYDVYYEIGSSATKYFVANVTVSYYTHTGLQSGTTYYYYIKAKNSAGYSEYSSFAYATTSSANVPGSSSSNAIAVTSSGYQGSFPSGLDAVWYKFTKYGSGGISVADRAYSSTWTSDVVIDLFDSASYSISVGGTTISDYDVGNGTSNWVYATNWSGTYYVKVKPKNGLSSNKGSYFIQCPH
jgi:hypothetical protein